MPGPNLGQKIGSAFVEVSASLVGFGEGLAGNISNALLAQTFVVGQAMESFGRAVFARFSVPLLAASAANIAQFQALDREIRTVLTLFGTADSLVRDTFNEMSEGIRSVSEEVGGLERDIADGLYQAISAGVPRGGVFDFLEVAQMAAMADRTADLTTAVDGLTTVVNAFGLESSDAERAADVMFSTVALGKTTFGELSQDIGRVAPLAANAGVAFEELFAIVGALTLQGLKTSEAISFMRASITGLLRPTDELNAVFREAGFASAEAAIPVIGLQAAFQTVFDAVGGSTSRMQELIGTSEGVSAILGVTGDNADTFARIMGSVEVATGSTQRAFEIMDGSVGRSFGRLTESFDRLGNTFGEMASIFAVPAVRAFTGIIDRVREIFASMKPIVEGLGIAFGTVMSILSVPVVKEIVAGFAALAVTISGLIGTLGILALTFGKVLTAGLQLRVMQVIITRLGGLINILQGGMAIASNRLAGMSAAMTVTGAKAGLLGKGVGNLSRLMKFMSTNVFRAGLALGGIGLAIGAVVAGFGYLIRKQREFVESQDVFGKGVDQLAESLGLLNQEITVPGVDEGVSQLIKFKDENNDLIQAVRGTADELGRLAASDVLEGIAVELVYAGNSPEEVLQQLTLLENATGISINLNVEDLSDGTTRLQEFSEAVLVAADRIGGPGGLSAQSANTAKGIAELFQQSRLEGDPAVFIATIEEVFGGMERTSIEAKLLGKALDSAFADLLGVDLVSWWESSTNIIDPQELIDRLSAAGFDIEPFDLPVEPTMSPDAALDFSTIGLGSDAFADLFPEEEIASATEFVDQFGGSLIDAIRIGEEGRDTYAGLFGDLQGLFDQARSDVLSAMADIRNEIIAQQPLLDIYSGAVKQSFAEWKTGQDNFQEDLKAVTTLRDRLVKENLPQELIDSFDRQPITKQAWLAGLGETQLQTALEELTESFELSDEAARERITQSFGGIISEAMGDLTEGYLELQEQADTEGALVGDKFKIAFEELASGWPVSAATWMSALEAQISRPLAGPVIGPPTFGSRQTSGDTSNPGGDTYNVTLEGSGNTLEDAERAAALLEINR